MLSSVPFEHGGEHYALQFTPGDVDRLETTILNMPAALFLEQRELLRLSTLNRLLWVGLKKPGEYGQNGEPIFALPQNEKGRERAQQMVYEAIKGKSPVELIAFGKRILNGFAAGQWFNIEKEGEASTSVPQGNETPKNSEVPG